MLGLSRTGGLCVDHFTAYIGGHLPSMLGLSRMRGDLPLCVDHIIAYLGGSPPLGEDYRAREGTSLCVWITNGCAVRLVTCQVSGALVYVVRLFDMILFMIHMLCILRSRCYACL